MTAKTDVFAQLFPGVPLDGAEARVLDWKYMSEEGVADAVQNYTEIGKAFPLDRSAQTRQIVAVMSAAEALSEQNVAPTDGPIRLLDATFATDPPELATTGGTPSVANDQLVLPPGASKTWITEITPRGVTFTAYGAVGSGATAPRIRVRSAQNPSNYLLLTVPGASTGSILSAVTSSTSPSTTESTPYDPAQHRHFRLREDNGSIYFEASTDYQSWTTLRRDTTPGWMARAGQFFVGGYGGKGQAVIDRLTVERAP